MYNCKAKLPISYHWLSGKHLLSLHMTVCMVGDPSNILIKMGSNKTRNCINNNGSNYSLELNVHTQLKEHVSIVEMSLVLESTPEELNIIPERSKSRLAQHTTRERKGRYRMLWSVIIHDWSRCPRCALAQLVFVVSWRFNRSFLPVLWLLEWEVVHWALRVLQ